VVIVGGGFGGLQVARGLRRARARVTLVDRQNHHLFQPLLYQVATAALSPAQIAAPLRGVLGAQRNTRVLMAEVVGVEPARRRVVLRDGALEYDWLVLAAGATHSYFGQEAWAPFAPGLKTLDDALEVRRRILSAFERAEQRTSPAEARADLTFVVVGGGATGVEMAGAIREIAVHALRADFRAVDTRQVRVLLVESQPRLLAGGFPERLSQRAAEDLRRLGVEVRTGSRVVAVERDAVTIRGPDGGDERVATRNVVWAAGVRASPLGAGLGAPLDRAGRVEVQPDLSLPGHPEVFVIGDMARVLDAAGQQVPGIAPAAMQMGWYVAARLREELRAARAPGAARPPFRYRDKGLLATIGRARAVALIGGRGFAGLLAWLLWAAVHITYLVTFRQRLLVFLDWIWSYVFRQAGARLITGVPVGGKTEEEE
jgi:NADH dehydrogenase